MDATFLQERITKTKELIVKYEDAIDALATTPVASYKLDTGQSSQTVTKADIKTLQEYLDVLYNRCVTFEYRLNGGNTSTMYPCW